ncbi:MAG: hypothetical protein OEZ54_07835 [Gemmatimonadota bacterium]|nr:hypothetical protein [Gemmatimonadota bacterium]
MPKVSFEEIPDTGKLWIFAADRVLASEEESTLLAAVDAFLEHWAAHDVPLRCARDWRYSQFLFVAVDEDVEAPSGCSIDAMTGDLRSIESKLGVVLIDNSPVLYRSGDATRRVTRAEFKTLAAQGEVGPDTIVFNNTITQVGRLRAGEWEGPASHSWHGKVFFPAVSEPAG